ncbi:hypothetical protein DL98DRAFT_517030 [Cadophora sp. DSE1049]|nr:hypothetical protein DL98DRAFT_517030 [Cadophora sp. DSE1049]
MPPRSLAAGTIQQHPATERKFHSLITANAPLLASLPRCISWELQHSLSTALGCLWR